MTAHEALVFGWIYGRVVMELQKSKLKEPGPEKFERACVYPLQGFAEIINLASKAKILKGDLDKDIGVAAWQIDTIEDDSPQPLPRQGSWQLGYYKGVSGKPVPPPENELDIEGKRREKSLSQEELAKLVGVTQSQVSRWEKGEAKPTEENLAKLLEVLK